MSSDTRSEPVIEQRHRDKAHQMLCANLRGMNSDAALDFIAAALAAAESSAERVCKWTPITIGARKGHFEIECDNTVTVECRVYPFCPYCAGRIKVEEAK